MNASYLYVDVINGESPFLSLCSIEVKSSTRPYAGCLFNLNVLLLPLTLALVALSSLFSAPLLRPTSPSPSFAVAFPTGGNSVLS